MFAMYSNSHVFSSFNRDFVKFLELVKTAMPIVKHFEEVNE